MIYKYLFIFVKNQTLKPFRIKRRSIKDVYCYFICDKFSIIIQSRKNIDNGESRNIWIIKNLSQIN